VRNLIQEFKDFIKRGSFVDLAVAVVIGAAVAAVISSVVEGLINPLIAAVFGEPDLTQVGAFTINEAEFSFGLILDAVINFLAVAVVLFFLVKAYNAFQRQEQGESGPVVTELSVLTEIRDELRAQRGGS
jgi:large conductance mechanosensitive channel